MHIEKKTHEVELPRSGKPLWIRNGLLQVKWIWT